MKAAFYPAWRKGLTLVELMVALTIVFILAAITASELGALPEESRRSAAANNARQIDAAYLLFAMSGDGRRTLLTPSQVLTGASPKDKGLAEIATTIEDSALALAKRSDLNDASVWFIATDSRLARQTIPRQVVAGDTRTAQACSPDFLKTSPKAWAMVAGLPATMAGNMTPLFWTYGLDTKVGRWVADSPWQGKGGHVAYLDGHVEWLEQLPANAQGFSFSPPSNDHAGIVPVVLNAMGH